MGIIDWLLSPMEIPILAFFIIIGTALAGAVLSLLTLAVFGQKPPRNIVKWIKNKIKGRKDK